ncbi:MAG: O-antigen ligase family protein, partial [Candidatus Promineifilaceae bacterium]
MRKATALHNSGWPGRLAAGLTAGLLLIMPLTAFRPLGPPAAADVLSLYVSRGVYLSDLLLAPLLLLALTRFPPLRLRPIGLWLPLAVVVLAGLASAAVALAPALAFYAAVRWALALFLYFWLLQPWLPLERLLPFFLAGLAIQALVGLAQVAAQSPLGLPLELALPAEAAGAAIVEVGGLHYLRAYGLTFHPNVLGGFLTAGLLLGWPLAFKGRPGRLAWWLLLLCLLATFSRAAWLALALTLPPLVFWHARSRDQRRPLALTVVGGLLILLAGLALWREPLATRLGPLGQALAGRPAAGANPAVAATERYALNERAELIAGALASIGRRPALGVGAGNSPLFALAAGIEARPQPVH